MTSTPSASPTCAHKGCNCAVDSKSAVIKDGKRYCSQGCAAGRGCDHADCNCKQS